MQRFRSFYWIVIWVPLILACTTEGIKKPKTPVEDNAYDSSFPDRDYSEAIGTIMNSITRVICVTYYTSYTFPEDMDLQPEDITNTLIKRYGNEYHFTDNVTGTATVLFYDMQKVLLLSAAHIFHKPDTIYTHTRKPERPYIQTISGIAIKDRQKNIAAEFYNNRDLEILFEDNENDLVLLGIHLDELPQKNISPITLPLGKSRKLSWGSIIYLMGYPKGIKSVTHGIVSQPYDKYRNRFMTDAPFNRGMSGGLALAINDGVPDFEIVGVASSAYSEEEKYLVPDMQWDYDPGLPYKGPIYIQNKKFINYGISIVSPVESVVNLLRKNRVELEKRGYNLTEILER